MFFISSWTTFCCPGALSCWKFHHDGVGEQTWQINTDERYFMDEDGFGMTNDEEVTIYGCLNRCGMPLAKLCVVKDLSELSQMREEAVLKLEQR